MIITQHPYIDAEGRERPDLVKTYSDAEGKAIRQIETGIVYTEAVDVWPLRYTYEEVDEPKREVEEPERPE